MVPVLELLFNLTAADAAMMTPWLTHCTPDRSSWGALKGLELAMNHRDEQVRLGYIEPSPQTLEKLTLGRFLRKQVSVLHVFGISYVLRYRCDTLRPTLRLLGLLKRGLNSTQKYEPQVNENTYGKSII